MTDNSLTSRTVKSAALSLAHLQIAQAQMAIDRYDFGAPVRLTDRDLTNLGDDVVAEIEFQNERGEFNGGPKGAFMVAFAPGGYDISDVRAMVNGRQVGHMPGAELGEFENRLDEGVDMLDADGVALIEDWLRARKHAKGYLLGARIGEARSLHSNEPDHVMLDVDDAVNQAIEDGYGGVSVLIVGQRADRVKASVAEYKDVLGATAKITNSVRR